MADPVEFTLLLGIMTKGSLVRKIFVIALSVVLSGCGFVDGDDKMNLIIACKDGDVAKVKQHLGDVNSPNFISLNGDTPLNTAIYNRHLSIIKLLIDSGASCSLKDEAGKTPMDVAKKVGDSTVLKYLESVGDCI